MYMVITSEAAYSSLLLDKLILCKMFSFCTFLRTIIPIINKGSITMDEAIALIISALKSVVSIVVSWVSVPIIFEKPNTKSIKPCIMAKGISLLVLSNIAPKKIPKKMVYRNWLT